MSCTVRSRTWTNGSECGLGLERSQARMSRAVRSWTSSRTVRSRTLYSSNRDVSDIHVSDSEVSDIHVLDILIVSVSQVSDIIMSSVVSDVSDTTSRTLKKGGYLTPSGGDLPPLPCLPRNLRFEVHKVLYLPRNRSANEPHAQPSRFTSPVTKSERLEDHDHVMSKVLHLPRSLHFEVQLLRSLAPVTKSRLWTTKE